MSEVYEALEEMCDMWRTVCDVNRWEPEHMTQYENARRVLNENASGRIKKTHIAEVDSQRLRLIIFELTSYASAMDRGGSYYPKSYYAAKYFTHWLTLLRDFGIVSPHGDADELQRKIDLHRADFAKEMKMDSEVFIL